MMPQTPLTPKRVLALATPRKRTLIDINSSYVEEEDATYVYAETTEISDLESDLDLDLVDALILEDELVFTDDTTRASADTLVEDEKPPKSSQPSEIYAFLLKHEIPRKLFHLSHGFLTLYLYTAGANTSQIMWGMYCVFACLLANDLFRFRNPEANKWIVERMRFVIREKEEHLWNGTLFYAAGVALVFTFYPKDIALMSVMLLSWCDTAASTFGRQFGKYTFEIAPGKSLAGSLASGVTGFAVCYLFYGYFVPIWEPEPLRVLFWNPETSSMGLRTYALVAGFAASLSEAVNVAGLDDNFTIPVLSSAMLYGAVWAAKL